MLHAPTLRLVEEMIAREVGNRPPDAGTSPQLQAVIESLRALLPQPRADATGAEEHEIMWVEPPPKVEVPGAVTGAAAGRMHGQAATSEAEAHGEVLLMIMRRS